MENLKVSDIMSAEVVTVAPDTTVRDLAGILAKHQVSGVPVVDSGGRVVGMVSQADVIVQDADLHFPYYISFLDSVLYLPGSIHNFEERFRKIFAVKVSDIMTKDVVSISPDASVHEAAALMADKEVNRLPVVSALKVVGIVTRGDIVQAIADHKA